MTNRVTMPMYPANRHRGFKVRKAILKGELAPGERLMEIQLAEKLGVSRTPIREAIRKLELEGLVLMIPRKGAEVAKISEKSLRDVLEVRRSLEELAIELACQRMSEDDMAELERMQGNFKSAIDRGEAMSIAQSDEQYHDVIYQGTRNDKLVQMLGNLREQMYRYRLEYIKDEDKRQVLLVEHEHILNALKNRNIAQRKGAGTGAGRTGTGEGRMGDETFKERYLSGEIPFEEIDRYVSRWNNSDDPRTLAQYLGLNAEEEDVWIDVSDEALQDMLDSQKR